jgi:hypothetical protein
MHSAPIATTCYKASLLNCKAGFLNFSNWYPSGSMCPPPISHRWIPQPLTNSQAPIGPQRFATEPNRLAQHAERLACCGQSGDKQTAFTRLHLWHLRSAAAHEREGVAVEGIPTLSNCPQYTHTWWTKPPTTALPRSETWQERDLATPNSSPAAGSSFLCSVLQPLRPYPWPTAQQSCNRLRPTANNPPGLSVWC